MMRCPTRYRRATSTQATCRKSATCRLLNFGYEGNGVTWAIVDTGVDRSHPDLLPNLGAGFTTADCTGTGGDDSSGGGHGTHVGGIVAGLGLGDGAGGDAEADANGFLYGLGVVPSATLYPIVSGCSSWPPSGGWQLHSKLAIAGGAVGMNASWTSGEGTAHGYQASERTHNLMVRDGDFPIRLQQNPLSWSSRQATWTGRVHPDCAERSQKRHRDRVQCQFPGWIDQWHFWLLQSWTRRGWSTWPDHCGTG